MKAPLLALIVAGAVATGASAQTPLKQAAAALERGDNPGAIALLLPLAEQGDAEAQFMLGRAYEGTVSALFKPDESLRWTRRAAEQGHVEALMSLAQAHLLGDSFVRKDPAEAAKWYRLAADRGQVSAQAMLAYLYRQGKGVPQNYVEAYKWSSIAAAGGSPGAKSVRDGLLGIMTPDQIAEGQKLAADWKPAT